nr:uncharacterized protein LOC101264547 [Solanum lycopersicum]
MYGYTLFGHLDGTSPSPSRTITLGTNISPNLAFLTWFCQDQLIQNALMDSVEPTIAPIVAVADSAKSAWDALHTTYANKSQTRVFSLRDQLARVTKDSRSITEYIHTIRSFSDELATAGAPVSNLELIVKILSVLDFELFLRHKDAKKLSSTITVAVANPTKFNSNNRKNLIQTNNSQKWRQNLRPSAPPQGQSSSNLNGIIRCQLCNKIGHIANVCRSRSQNHLKQKPTMPLGLQRRPIPG